MRTKPFPFATYLNSPYNPSKLTLGKIDDFNYQPELASGRIRDFRGGVYKRYQVRGPMTLTVRISRNYSFNTIVAGLFLDLIDECPPPYFRTLDDWKVICAQREKTARAFGAPRVGNAVPALDSEPAAAANISDCLDLLELVNPSWHAAAARPYYLTMLRWHVQAGNTAARTDNPLLKRRASCQYNVQLHGDWENTQRQLGLVPARDIEKAIRWDGTPWSCQGKAYLLVREHIANQRTLLNNEIRN